MSCGRSCMLVHAGTGRFPAGGQLKCSCCFMSGLTVKPVMHNIYFTQCYKGMLVTGMLTVEEALGVDPVVRT